MRSVSSFIQSLIVVVVFSSLSLDSAYASSTCTCVVHVHYYEQVGPGSWVWGKSVRQEREFPAPPSGNCDDLTGEFLGEIPGVEPFDFGRAYVGRCSPSGSPTP